jgi:predicted dehydrogenase
MAALPALSPNTGLPASNGEQASEAPLTTAHRSESMNHPISRRSFLTGAALTVAGIAAGRESRAQPARPRPGQKVRLGIIGCGGQGEFNWSNLAGEEIVALCDVDLARTARAAERFPKATVVQDFRRVIERDDIDAVVVSTPDHWHALPSVWAMETGKHVYCEKPLGHTVAECRVMAETAKRRGVATQMGTQIHAGSNYRRVVELVRGGAIGPIRRVDVWVEGRAPARRRGQGTPPSTLDYPLWVGPAPTRPYDPGIVPFQWRWWWEFGGGVLGDMGCHYMDLAHWALELRHPVRITAAGTLPPDADNTVPAELRVDYDYPARGSQPPVRLTWWHGTPGPRDDGGRVRRFSMGSAVLFHGEQGELLANYSDHKLLPESRFVDFRRPEPTIPDSVGHHQEWINAIRDGSPTTCNFDTSGALTEAVHLGNVSFRLGKAIDWDAKALKVTNVRGADEFVQYDYQNGWRLLEGRSG